MEHHEDDYQQVYKMRYQEQDVLPNFMKRQEEKRGLQETYDNIERAAEISGKYYSLPASLLFFTWLAAFS